MIHNMWSSSNCKCNLIRACDCQYKLEGHFTNTTIMATSKEAGYVCCSKEEKEDDTQYSSCECTSNMFKCMFPASIQCHKKVQACQWTGPLKDLDAHTCYYVDVECPKSCGENVQKQNVETCAKECPKRDNQCLNYEKTFCGAFQHLISEHKEEFETHLRTIEPIKRPKFCKKSRTYTLVNYKKCKREKKKEKYSLNFSKDPAYPDLTLWIYPNGTKEGTGSHLSLTVSLLPDDKDQSDLPFSLTITVELLNQRGDQNYVKEMTKESVHFKHGFSEEDMSNIKFISLDDLESEEDKKTQYLKIDGSLKFRISTEVHHS